MRPLLTLAVLLAPASVLAQEKAELPRVVLLGDSIRIGYAPLVAKKLEGVAVVVHPGMENCADTPTTLNVQEAFMVWFKVCLVCGFVIGSPWIFYQIWAFVAAGLYPHEKRLVHVYLPVSLGLSRLGTC